MGSTFVCLCVVLVSSGTSYGYREFHTFPTPKPIRNFKPQVKSKTCFLIPEKGPCRGDIPMYYYDASNNDCSTFKWGGCQGNGNRFDTIEECRGYCFTSPGDSKARPEYCSLSFDYGYCFGAVERYYYDRLYKVCKKTIYSGCGGNKNNFLMKEQCQSICAYGNGPLVNSSPRTWNGVKKVLIINPFDASTKRKGGVIQTTYAPSTVVQTAPPLTMEVTPSTETMHTKVLRNGETPEIWMGKK